MLLTKVLMGLMLWGLICLWPTILLLDAVEGWGTWMVVVDVIILFVVVAMICNAHEKG